MPPADTVAAEAAPFPISSLLRPPLFLSPPSALVYAGLSPAPVAQLPASSPFSVPQGRGQAVPSSSSPSSSSSFFFFLPPLLRSSSSSSAPTPLGPRATSLAERQQPKAACSWPPSPPNQPWPQDRSTTTSVATNRLRLVHRRCLAPPHRSSPLFLPPSLPSQANSLNPTPTPTPPSTATFLLLPLLPTPNPPPLQLRRPPPSSQLGLHFHLHITWPPLPSLLQSTSFLLLPPSPLTSARLLAVLVPPPAAALYLSTTPPLVSSLFSGSPIFLASSSSSSTSPSAA